MKKGKIWILVSALLALTMLLAACNGGTTTKTTTIVTGSVSQSTGTTSTVPTSSTVTSPTSVTTTAANPDTTPIYGGTVTFITANPTRWDPGELGFASDPAGVHEYLTGADWTKGPQGTNAFPFDQQTIPDAYIIGLLSESIEVVDKYTLIHHLRHGITYWGANPKVPGYGREMVAADYIAASIRMQAMPRSTVYRATGEKDVSYVFATAVAGDKYAVQIRNQQPIVNIASGAIANLYPAESATTTGFDPADWRNAIGTGSFCVTDYVPDSSISYIANPNYWETDPLHPGYKRPYLDGFRFSIIVDPATQMAALQTGKVITYGFSKDRGDYLIKNNPELKYVTRPENYDVVIFMRVDKAPFNNLQVRRALAIAIDRQGMLAGLMGGKGNLLAWPLWSSVGNDIYTPMDQLPADVQELYNYNPAKAKQMLADAGYPTGFPIELDSPQVEDYINRATLVKANWDAIGCTTTIQVIESGTFYNNMYGKTYPNTAIVAWGNSSQWSVLGWCWRSTIIYNYGNVNDPKIDQAYLDALNETDTAKRNAIFKPIYVYGMQQSWEIALPQPITYVFWQPYMHGYAGEYAAIASRIWIDPVLKKQMGR